MPIQLVGVKDIRHPIRVQSAQGTQASVATINMYVGLAANVKGTHMSRFIELLQTQDAPINAPALRTLMTAMLQKLEAQTGHIKLSFPYFVPKSAPVSGVTSLMDYQVELLGEAQDGQTTITMTVAVPVTSLCPCSKTISAYGAHNQRSHITLAVRLGHTDLAVETLIGIAEQAASCEIWGLLKRSDEKFVTERAYENPKFVEDLVRDVAAAVAQLPGVAHFRVEAENFESIHNHSAYAQISQGF